MGTRNVTRVIKDGKTVVSQYGQWDGYPDTAGVTIFQALQRVKSLEKLENGLKKCYFASDEEINRLASEPGWINLYPTLVRDMGYGIIDYIMNSDKDSIPLGNCVNTFGIQYMYTIDLDKNLFICDGMYPEKTLFSIDIHKIVSGEIDTDTIADII